MSDRDELEYAMSPLAGPEAPPCFDGRDWLYWVGMGLAQEM